MRFRGVTRLPSARPLKNLGKGGLAKKPLKRPRGGDGKMRQVITLLMISTIFTVYMFQPFLNEIYHLRNLALQITLDRGIEKAAVDGRFTDEVITEMKSTMANQLHFSTSVISFSGTTQVTPRGGYIEGNLGIPAGQLWILPSVFGGGEDIRELRAYAKQMSEYIPR